MRRRSGFTLLEVLVYTTLLSALLSALYGILITLMDYSRVAQATIEVQTSAQKAASALVSELADSRTSTVSTYSSPSGIIFCSADNGSGANSHTTDSGGNLQWQKWVCYYVDSSTKRLIRRELAISGGPTTPPANTNTSTTFSLMTGGRVVAQNVTSFIVSGGGPFMVTIGVGQTVYSNQAQTKDNTIYMVDEVSCRNN